MIIVSELGKEQVKVKVPVDAVLKGGTSDDLILAIAHLKGTDSPDGAASKDVSSSKTIGGVVKVSIRQSEGLLGGGENDRFVSEIEVKDL